MTAPYVQVTDFVDSLRAWSSKPLSARPADRAPCGYLPGVDDENRVLADIFAKVSALPTTTERLTFLLSAIQVHQRRLDMAWDAARGSSNTRTMLTTDRSAMVRLRPYEQMIAVLKAWLDEMHEAAASEIGVRFIDEAARKAS